jgi:lipoprotein-releasing system permease protein
VPLVAEPEVARGDIGRFSEGIAIGSGVARELGVDVGDSLRLISPDGARTPFGTSPRVSAYEVVYIFQVGRWDIDRVRVYMPFAEAQSYFNRDGVADEIEVMLDDPEDVGGMVLPILTAAGGGRCRSGPGRTVRGRSCRRCRWRTTSCSSSSRSLS